MKIIPWVLLLLLLNCPLACQERKKQQQQQHPSAAGTMKVTIINKILYPNIASASGLEILGDKVYVVGDDTPFLYVLNTQTLELEKTIRLFETNNFGTGRIPKALKPDLECLTTLPVGNDTLLLALGSGSAPTRTKCYTIKLPAAGETAAVVKEYSLESLYRTLQQDTTVVGEDLLNLEAAAVTPDNQLLLLQRSALTGPNTLLRFGAGEFTQYFTGQAAQLPPYTVYSFQLPRLLNLEARFSGAFTFDDKLFFTASVENTTDAILDGEVMGSFVGWLSVTAWPQGNSDLPLHTALIINPNGEPYIGKVESLAILEKEGPTTYRGLAITDNDNGESELLEIRLQL